jgi:hypothetical protein
MHNILKYLEHFLLELSSLYLTHILLQCINKLIKKLIRFSLLFEKSKSE